MISVLSHSYWITALGNHLWQSTILAAAAWLLTVALRRNAARTRHWLWTLASAKFLVPLSILIAAGEWLHPATAAVNAQPELLTVMTGVTQPLAAPSGASALVLPRFGIPADMGAPSSAARWDVLFPVLLGIWALGMVFVLARWAVRWWSLRRVVHEASPLPLQCSLPVLSTRSRLEPGVFGIFRPVLLLPEGICERLSAEQLDSIIAHELSHVRRRDNLWAAFHMVVEAAFWFYPPVWWIGNRLVEERERACDEAVLESRREPAAYAEGILGVCKNYLEVPVRCVAGVTGADLKKRIARIMTHSAVRKLDLRRKMLLSAAAVLVIVVPVMEGVMHAAARQDQAASSSEGITGTWQGTLHGPRAQLRLVVKVSGTAPNHLKVVTYSIDQGGQPIPASSASFEDGVFKYAIQLLDAGYQGKLSTNDNSISGTWTQGPGSLPLILERATPETAWTLPAPLPKVPEMAANANPSFEVATIKPSKPGEPGKLITVQGTRFRTVNFTLLDLIKFAYGVQEKQVIGGPKWISSDKFDIQAEPNVPGTPDAEQLKSMVQKFMADRFGLKFHRETKTMSAYVLTVGKSGPKMTKDTNNPNGLPALFFRQLGVLTVANATMDEFAGLMQSAVLDRPVVNETNLQGKWDFLLKWTPDESQFQGMGVKVPPPSDAANAPPPLFTAIQEQIGLKLKAGKSPVPVLVIDHVAPPSPN